MDIKRLIQEMVDRDASDLFFRAGGTPRLRIDGKIIPMDTRILSIEDVMFATEQLANTKQCETFRNKLDVDFGVYLAEFNRRFRVSILHKEIGLQLLSAMCAITLLLLRS